MKSLKDVWDSVLKRLGGELSDVTIRTWFDEVDVVTLEDSALVLHCSNTFKKSTIEARFLPHIKAALRDLFSTDLEVKILDDEQLSAYHGVAPDRPGDLSESEAFTFETYVVGPQNKLAFAASKAVTEKPGENYNPLFIYGDSGLGKTHLLYAIANALRKKRPAAKIVYIKGDDFTNELVASIQEGKNAEFREKYRQATLLLVDDVQFIAGKNTTQEEFFNTFNTLHTSGKQIVISSDKPPKEIPALEERLRSRFEGGLITDIQSPDYETRMAILQKKADQENIIIDPRVLSLIATKANANIRQLEGAFTRVVAFSKLLGTPITLSMADAALKDIIEDVQERRVTVPMVQQVVADFYNVSVDAMTSSRRTADVTYPRQVAMYLSREMTDLSLKAIGEQFGGRNYSTIISACNKIEDDMRFDPELGKVFKDLKKRIKGN